MSQLLRDSLCQMYSRTGGTQCVCVTAERHPWFQHDLNCPKIRAVRSLIFDDHAMWGSPRFTNDVDSETPHRKPQQKARNEVNHQRGDDMKHVLGRIGNEMLMKCAFAGMRVGPEFKDTIAPRVRDARDPENPERLMNFFQRGILVPHEGM